MILLRVDFLASVAIGFRLASARTEDLIALMLLDTDAVAGSLFWGAVVDLLLAANPESEDRFFLTCVIVITAICIARDYYLNIVVVTIVVAIAIMVAIAIGIVIVTTSAILIPIVVVIAIVTAIVVIMNG